MAERTVDDPTLLVVANATLDVDGLVVVAIFAIDGVSIVVGDMLSMLLLLSMLQVRSVLLRMLFHSFRLMLSRQWLL